MTRFYNSRPCNGTATHINELSETLWMPKCQPAPTRVLLTKSTPHPSPSPSPGVLDTEMLPAVPLRLQSTQSAHILLARPSSLSGLAVAPHCSHTHSPLAVQENQPAENGINVLQLPRGASTLWNLIWCLLCASESQNQHKRPWSHWRSPPCSGVSSAPQKIRSWCLLFYLTVWEGSKANCDQPSLDWPATLCESHLRTQRAYWLTQS